MVIAGLVANWLSAFVRGATTQTGLSNPNFVPSIAKAAIWGFGIIIAVNQIGVAETFVNTLFMGLIGALALVLAFGLGGRGTAGEIVREWYQQGSESAPKLATAAEAAEAEHETLVPVPTRETSIDRLWNGDSAPFKLRWRDGPECEVRLSSHTH